MKFLGALLQIGELFNGRFNWRGVFHLSLFILMALIIIGFVAFIGYNAFRSKK